MRVRVEAPLGGQERTPNFVFVRFSDFFINFFFGQGRDFDVHFLFSVLCVGERGRRGGDVFQLESLFCLFPLHSIELSKKTGVSKDLLGLIKKKINNFI